MWLTKWKKISVSIGIIHYIIWGGLLTPDLTMDKLLICSGQTFTCEIQISLVSKPSLRFTKHEMGTWNPLWILWLFKSLFIK